MAVSTPGATDVVSVNVASAGLASPDSESLAVHEIETLPGCHVPSTGPQESVGGVPSRGPTIRLGVVGAWEAVLLAASVRRRMLKCHVPASAYCGIVTVVWSVPSCAVPETRPIP